MSAKHVKVEDLKRVERECPKPPTLYGVAWSKKYPSKWHHDFADVAYTKAEQAELIRQLQADAQYANIRTFTIPGEDK